jgi:DNA-directed RNA polymerase alpha subunit
MLFLKFSSNSYSSLGTEIPEGPKAIKSYVKAPLALSRKTSLVGLSLRSNYLLGIVATKTFASQGLFFAFGEGVASYCKHLCRLPSITCFGLASPKLEGDRQERSNPSKKHTPSVLFASQFTCLGFVKALGSSSGMLRSFFVLASISWEATSGEIERHRKHEIGFGLWGYPLAHRTTLAKEETQHLARKTLARSKQGAKDAIEEQKFFISCAKSRIETNRCFYGCFYLGPFDPGQSLTVANALRRTLLSELRGIAITSVEIEGALHEYSNLPGVRDSVLDILLNLKEIVLKKKNYLKFFKTQVGYLRAQGPGIVTAADLLFPPFLQCVDPEQYIATLSEDGFLNMKFFINEGKNYHIQTSVVFPVASAARDLQSNSFIACAKVAKVASCEANKQGQQTFSAVLASQIGLASPQEANKPKPSTQLTQPKVIQATTPTVKKTVHRKPPKQELERNSEATLEAFILKKKDLASNSLLIDAVFMPVLKVNYIIESHELANDLLAGSPNLYNPEENFLSNFKLDKIRNAKLQSNSGEEGILVACEAKPSVVLRGTPTSNSPLVRWMKQTPLLAQSNSSNTFGDRVLFRKRIKKKKQPLASKLKQALTASLGELRTANVVIPLQEGFVALSPYSEASPKKVISTEGANKQEESNFLIRNTKTTQAKIDLKQNVVLEIWTNGSLHPRQALNKALKNILSVFYRLKKVKFMGSMYKSEKSYKNYFIAKSKPLSKKQH